MLICCQRVSAVTGHFWLIVARWGKVECLWFVQLCNWHVFIRDWSRVEERSIKFLQDSQQQIVIYAEKNTRQNITFAQQNFEKMLSRVVRQNYKTKKCWSLNILLSPSRNSLLNCWMYLHLPSNRNVVIWTIVFLMQKLLIHVHSKGLLLYPYTNVCI